MKKNQPRRAASHLPGLLYRVWIWWLVFNQKWIVFCRLIQSLPFLQKCFKKNAHSEKNPLWKKSKTQYEYYCNFNIF